VFYITDYALGERAALRGEDLARELGDEESLVRCMALRGGALISSGPARFEDGIATIEQAVEMAKRVGLTHLVATASRGLALAYTFDSRFEEAQAVLDQVFGELERLGERETLSDAYLGSRFFQNRLYLASDNLSSAERYARETLELARRAENRTVASMGLSTLATIAFVCGAYAEAETWAQQALSLGIEIGNAVAIGAGQLVALGVRLGAGDRSASSEELNRIDHGFASGGDRVSDTPLMVEVLVAAGAVDRADRLARASFDRAGGQLARARVSTALGQVDLERGPGCWAEAERRFGEALETSTALGARSTVALSRLGLARLAADRGDRDTARRQARLAEESFEELGMAHYAEAAGRVGEE
jgi:tetratricopeptide (TPR) repeat protein